MTLPASSSASATPPDPVAQARAAWEKCPNDLAALTQALLDAGQAAAAYDMAQRTYPLHPHALTAMEKLALAAIATQRWPIAHGVLRQVEKSLQATATPLPAQLVRLLAELWSLWWLGLEKGGGVLRRPSVADTSFIAASFANRRFMQHYHRFQKGDAAAVQHFITTAQAAPQESRRLDWIIGDAAGQALGLGAIVDIDYPNQRGELFRRWPSTVPAARAMPHFLSSQRRRIEGDFNHLINIHPPHTP